MPVTGSPPSIEGAYHSRLMAYLSGNLTQVSDQETCLRAESRRALLSLTPFTPHLFHQNKGVGMPNSQMQPSMKITAVQESERVGRCRRLDSGFAFER